MFLSLFLLPSSLLSENIYINASIFGLSRKEIDKRVESIIDFSKANGKKKDLIDLSPENIEVSDDKSLKFTFVEKSEHDFSFNFSQLMIRILRHVDIKSREALQLAYALFVVTSKSGFSINDIENVLCEFEAKDHMKDSGN